MCGAAALAPIKEILVGCVSVMLCYVHVAYVHMAIQDLVVYSHALLGLDVAGSHCGKYCTISINLSPLCDCDVSDEIFISSPGQVSCDKVQISSGGPDFGKNYPIQDICDKLPICQVAL